MKCLRVRSSWWTLLLVPEAPSVLMCMPVRLSVCHPLVFAFGGAYWSLATAHSDHLWARTRFGCVKRGGGGAPCNPTMWTRTDPRY